MSFLKKTVDFREILKLQRDCYLRQLTKFYSERPTGAKEILLVLNGDEKEKIFKLYRLDHFEQIDGESKPTEMGPDTYVSHKPIDYTFGCLNVEMNPFYWHGCNFILDKELTDIEWLITWTRKWIDENDQSPVDGNGFSGVIHNVTRPMTSEDGIKFSVDFGTASEESFIELVELVEQLGQGRLRIGSFEMID